MDFFKSVFADDPPPSDDYNSNPQIDFNPDPDQSPRASEAWSFGRLITTLATKSESVIQNYRRDLEEFGSGLKKETAVIRHVASRAVKDLPGSLEVGASVAQESLETVGQAIDDIGSTVWKSTAEIISHGRDAISADDDVDNIDYDDNNVSVNREISGDNKRSLGYSRFEAQVRGVQSNMITYLEEPEDSEGFRVWKLGFRVEEKAEEVEDLMRENGVVAEIYGEIVPARVEEEDFWARYFYRVHKLKEVEDARARLVNRAISGEEEDLSWDFDDDDDDVEKEEGSGSGLKAGLSGSDELDKQKEGTCDDGVESAEIAARESVSSDEDREKAESKFDESGVLEGKAEGGDSCKESDISIVSNQPSMPEEEDLGWDEIEDIGSSDENKVGEASGSGANRADLHKRLSAAEEEEDLSWDIEDDEDAAIKS